MNYDLITVGRVSLDLFARDIGAPFHAINAFETSVGGSPVNIAIGTSRLGLQSIAFTAVGEDEVGKFVLRYLQRAGVHTQFIPRKALRRTGMALVGVQPPDRFPLLFYRDNAADIHLTLDDALALPLHDSAALLLSGTAFSRGATRDVCIYLAEQARALQRTTFLDLDLRPDQWQHPLAFGLNLRPILPLCDVVIGTEEEFAAALLPKPEAVIAGTSMVDQAGLLQAMRSLQASISALLVLKRGAQGLTLFTKGKAIDVPGYTVEVLNTVGAGDGFASGLIYGWAQGWDWQRAARFANACGALVVTRHGCASALPQLQEVEAFMRAKEPA